MPKLLVRLFAFILIPALVLDPGTVHAFCPSDQTIRISHASKNSGLYAPQALSTAALWMLMSEQHLTAADARVHVRSSLHPVALQWNLWQHVQSLWHTVSPLLWFLPVYALFYFIMFRLMRKPDSPESIQREIVDHVAKLEKWTELPLIDQEVLDRFKRDPASSEWRVRVRRHLHQALAAQSDVPFGASGDAVFQLILEAASDPQKHQEVSSEIDKLLEQFKGRIDMLFGFQVGCALGTAVFIAVKQGRLASVGDVAKAAGRNVKGVHSNGIFDGEGDVKQRLHVALTKLESWGRGSFVTSEAIEEFQQNQFQGTWYRLIDKRLHSALSTQGEAVLGSHARDAFRRIVQAATDPNELIALETVLSRQIPLMKNSDHLVDMFAGWLLGMGVLDALHKGQPASFRQVVKTAWTLSDLLEPAFSAQSAAASSGEMDSTEFDVIEAMPYKVRMHAAISEAAGTLHQMDIPSVKLLAAPLQGLSADSAHLLDRMLGFPAMPEGMSQPPEYYVFGIENRPAIIARKSLLAGNPATDKALADIAKHLPDLVNIKGAFLHPGLPGFMTTIDFAELPDANNMADPATLIKAITAHFRIPIQFTLQGPSHRIAIDLIHSPERLDIILGTKEKPETRSPRAIDEDEESPGEGTTLHSSLLAGVISASLFWPRFAEIFSTLKGPFITEPRFLYALGLLLPWAIYVYPTENWRTARQAATEWRAAVTTHERPVPAHRELLKAA